MFKIKIITIGKIKESWLEEALQEYTIRLKKGLSIEWVLAKNTQQLEALIEKESAYCCLDPQGKAFTSEEFAVWFQKELVKGGARMTLIIGGDIGLSSKVKKEASTLISLSRLTFTHQLTRLILLEQIYRALEIERGSPYHK